MRFANFAIDLAAVLSASRSVASKHIALRSRQIDAYTRTSSVARSVRNQAVAGLQKNLRHQNEAREASPSPEAAPQAGTGVDTNAKPLSSQSIQDAIRETNDIPDGKPKSPTPEDVSTANGRGGKTDQSPGATASSEEFNVPSGIDVNVFHSARASQMLDSLRKEKTQQPRVKRPSAPPGQAKEHPLRNWPPPSPVEQYAAPKAEPTPDASLGQDGAPNSAAQGSRQTIAETPKPEVPEAIVSDAQPQPKEPDPEIVEVAKKLTGASPDAATPYSLRESKVPASRFSRIWNYGGLAAGMLGGAMTESVSRAFGSGGQGSVLLSGANMERLVAKLSRMRGAALKLGQMMSFQDSKMLPQPIQQVLQRVQDKADYMPAWQRDKVLTANLGPNWRELYSEFEEKPIAAASIGQVHKATLKSNGKRVAVKIQFPGVADSITSDLDNLGILLNATKLLPKGLYLNKTIDNARLELGWECDYVREAECARRYKELLSTEADVFLVPDVYAEASGKQVLTMDFMDGLTITRIQSFTQEQRDWIGTQIMRLCLREITEFKFMQTDPNWTNFLYNSEQDRLVLLDFGASREYPEEFVRQYVQLLNAAAKSDREGVKTLSESLGYLTGHESKTMLDAHTQSVLTLAEPFLRSAPEVYDFHDQTITERVKALIPVMLHERLAPPPEETYSLHRKLSGAFLLCARLGSKVRCREMFAQSVAKSGYVE